MAHECSECGDRFPTGKDVSMHNRIVHTDDALFIHNDPSGEGSHDAE